MNRFLKLIIVFLYLSPVIASAADSLTCRLSGRMLLDGSVYLFSPETLTNRLDIVDLRLAGKVNYGNWALKIDVGFAQNKLKIKDAFMQYSRNGNYFRLGYMLGFFSTDQSASTNDFTFNTGANVAETFYPGRRNGFSYTRSVKKYYLSAGVFLGDGINPGKGLKKGYNGSLRVLWRPFNREDMILHLGVAGFYRVPDMDLESGKRTVSIGSTGVTYTTSPQLQRLDVPDVRNQFETGAELYFTKDKFLLQSEYLFMGIDRMQEKMYRAQGGYIQMGWLLKGRHYGYDQTDALPMMPLDKGSLLLLFRYNINCLNDSHSGLEGGDQQDVSVGLNYYFNKYISTRLNYTYLNIKGGPLGQANIHQLQFRLQFRF